MANTIHLLLGVHNHQPVDNWDHVMEDAYKKCYKPFLDVLESHPKVAMSVHYTGYLLDWLADKHPELIEQLRRLIEKGQVEMFTGGFYEPILATIPDEDKVGQVLKLTQRVKELTGADCQGLWLAERVWEPHLVRSLADANVKYLCVDDAHFKSVGLDDQELLGRYTSEELGKKVDIFPVSKDLRYLIPYAQPQEIVDYLTRLATEQGDRAGIYFDDGEKFGVWPGTYKSVFTEKWLDRFFSALEAHSEVIKTVTPSQYVEKVPSFGRIYLPTASYSEMLEWALPAKHINTFERALHEAPEHYQRFLRGGFWRHFLVKYPEANNIHKKMLYVGDKVRQLQAQNKPVGEKALNELWMGQSNDIFWHGVFGGLYLTNLRTANYQHLLKAEALADAVLQGGQFFQIKTQDFDCDGHDEILVESQTQNLYFAPNEGGALFELDFRPKAFNLLDTLARRYEAYHDKLAHAVFDDGSESNEAQSIHDRVVTKEKGLDQLLHYDWHRRLSLLDHFFGPDTTLDRVYHVDYPEQGDFVNQPYTVAIQGNELTMTRTGRVWVEGQATRIQVKKHLTFDKNQAETLIRYEVTNLDERTASLWFSPEFNVNMLAPDAPDRYYYLPTSKAATPASGGGTAVAEDVQTLRSKKLASKGEIKETQGIGLIDAWMGIDYALTFSQKANVWRFPIETVSQSEAGFEKVYQSSVLLPNWKFELAPNQTWSVGITQRIQSA